MISPCVAQMMCILSQCNACFYKKDVTKCVKVCSEKRKKSIVSCQSLFEPRESQGCSPK